MDVVLDVYAPGTTGRKVIEYKQEDEEVEKQGNFLGLGAVNQSDEEMESEDEEEVTVVRKKKKKT